LAIYGCVEMIAVFRWQLLLRVQEIHLGWHRVFMLLMIGLFFNFFAPGGTGGDMVKVFYLLKETPGRRAHAFLSALVDRLIGIFSLVTLAGVLIATHWRWLMASQEAAQYVWAALGILALCVLGIAISFVITGCGLVGRIPKKMPGRDTLAELAMAYNLYGRAWKSTAAAWLISIAAHFGYFATFWCAARAVGSAGVKVPTMGELCAIMPIVNTIIALPISVGGVGVREGLFQVLLSNLAGVTEAVAVVVSSTGYLLTLAWGLVGGVLYILYRPSEHARLHDISAEVAAFEHTVAEDEIAAEKRAREREGSR
jgi:uncharacterized protein (TIRG00374 family)